VQLTRCFSAAAELLVVTRRRLSTTLRLGLQVSKI